MKKLIAIILSFSIFSISSAIDIETKFSEGQRAFSIKNYTKAFQIWLPLAENGHVSAQSTIAYLYGEGLGTDQNYSESVKWYLKAAKAGNVEAMHSLGVAYRYGRGIEKDLNKAELLYRRSYCKGYVIAIDSMVGLYKEGKLSINSEAEEIALQEEIKLLEDPSYIPWLLKKSRENLERKKVTRIAGLSCTSGNTS